MLCCLGLFIGYYIGESLGGSWVIIAPGIGFVLGFIFDMKFMHGRHHKTSHRKSSQEYETKIKNEPENEIVYESEYLIVSEAWKDKLNEN
jgi:hypothetical protein